MKLKPAELKTEQEAQHRMIDGEVFKFKNLNIYYSSNLNRFIATDEVTALTDAIPWEHVTEWQVEIPRTWEDDIIEGQPILCECSTNFPVLRTAKGLVTIVLVKEDGTKEYFIPRPDNPLYGQWFNQATPITPYDPAIYKGEK